VVCSAHAVSEAKGLASASSWRTSAWAQPPYMQSSRLEDLLCPFQDVKQARSSASASRSCAKRALMHAVVAECMRAGHLGGRILKYLSTSTMSFHVLSLYRIQRHSCDVVGMYDFRES
jgi:hypothetical protein